MFLCLGCGGMGGAGGCVGGLEQGMQECGGVMSVWVVSLDSLCRWHVQISVHCASRIPVHLRCTQCSILLQFMLLSTHSHDPC